ncbi:MAG: sigma-70 family RNA polymerase sigma factor [Bacteroidota bacterium]|nr:sigma-70 family RNA polymerase sigma factor [Bacteroidota bacterium]
MTAFINEQELLAALRRSDSSAFRKVYVLHFNMARYFILKNNGSEEDAHDIFQEAMVVLFEQLSTDKFTLTSSLKTWLYAVCRNKWLKQLEKQKRNVRLTDFESADDVLLPEEIADENEKMILLRKSLTRLGIGCRKLLLLFYYFKKSMEEIAVELNYTNADNAKSQKYKCLQKLKSVYSSTPE